MRIFRKLLVILPLCLLSCMFATKDNGPYCPPVDMERFSGLWFELARKPIFFQGISTLCWTEYKVCHKPPDNPRCRKDASPLILVKTTCLLPNGTLKQLCGSGKIYDLGYNHRLLLAFALHERIGTLLGKYNYVIYYVNEEYTQAIIGSPNHRYLWLLSKDPLVSDEDYQKLVCIAKSYDFNTENLFKDTWNETNYKALFPCLNQEQEK